MTPGTTRALVRPLAPSAVRHAAASPVAGALGMAACPLLDSTGLTGVSLAMLVTGAVACVGYWAGQYAFTRRWLRAATGAPLPEKDVVALFKGTFRGVLVHVAAYLVATLA